MITGSPATVITDIEDRMEDTVLSDVIVTRVTGTMVIVTGVVMAAF